MGVSDYIKRVVSELTGHESKQSPSFSTHQSMLVAAVVVVFALGFVGWLLGLGESPGRQSASECAFRVSEVGAPAPVTEGDATNINTCMKLERVASPSSLQLGLSNRPSLERDKGMLFDFHEPDKHCMWMKDMHFSLDIIWLNEKFEIVAMREQVSPDTYPRSSFCGPETARYVIEVNAGIIRAGDLRLGQHVTL